MANEHGRNIQEIREVRSTAGLGFGKAKTLVGGAAKAAEEDVSKADAEQIKGKIEEVGGTVKRE